VEDLSSCDNQKTHILHKELRKKTEEMQVDLQVTRTSVDMRTKSLLEAITDTSAPFHKELHNPGWGTNYEDLNRYHAVRTQGQGSRNWGKGREQKENRNWCVSGETLKSDRTALWAAFQCQFEAVADYNWWTCTEKSTYLITALQGHFQMCYIGRAKRSDLWKHSRGLVGLLWTRTWLQHIVFS
jgi:hypothetical protein